MRHLTRAVIGLGLFVNAHATDSTHAPLDDCGRYFGAMAAREFVIDELSSRDVEIDTLLMPVFAPYLSTRVGTDRLRWWLHHPALDAAVIRDRQAAVRALADAPETRAALKATLARIETRLGGGFDLHMDRLKDGVRFAPRGVVEVGRAVSATLLSGAGVLSAIGEREALAAPFLLAMMGLGNVNSENKRRDDVRVFEAAVMNAPDLHARSKDLPTRAIEHVRTILAGVQQTGGTVDLTAMRRRFRRSYDGVLTPIGSAFFLSNPGTRRLRDAIVAHDEGLRALVAAIAELDVLVALGEFYQAHRDALVFPNILDEDGATFLDIQGGHHPLLWTRPDVRSVANTFTLGAAGSPAPSRFYLLTGPNVGGKATYLKMIESQVLLAQIGAPVPARSVGLTPLALFTYKHADGRLQAGESSFFAQAKRVADILDRAEAQRHALILADELLTGTSPEEHTAIERAVIEYTVRSKHIGLLATHDRKLHLLEDELEGVTNIHVDDTSHDTYHLLAGPSRKRNAIEILRAAGVKAEVVAAAARYLERDHPEM